VREEEQGRAGVPLARIGTGRRNVSEGVQVQRSPRIRIGALPVDVIDQAGLLDQVDGWITREMPAAIFTPNVDHVVQAEDHVRFREAYARAELSVVDGTPVLWASRLLGTPLPQKLSGSDLIVPLCRRAAERRHRVFLLGGAPGVAEAAASVLRASTGVEIVGTFAPTVTDPYASDVVAAISRRLQESGAHLVFVAMGAPKQELLIDALKPHVKAVMVGIGAGLDFVAGRQKRAPAWMSRLGLEWLHRLFGNPRRLWRRYLLRDPRFLAILLRQLRGVNER